MKRAVLISIGDELLLGQTVNTNIAWLGEQLTSIGWTVVRGLVIGDDESAIVDEIRDAAERADVVIVSGGLGPTHDDRTRAAICRLLKCDLVLDVDQLARIETRFGERGINLNERSKQQAMAPSACRRLPNHYGSAPGLAFTINGRPVYALPGVPSELRGIATDFVLPELDRTGGAIDKRTFLLYGVTESDLADRLDPVRALLNDQVTLAYLPGPGGIRLRAMKSDDNPDTRERYDALIQRINELALQFIVSDRDETLVDVVGRLMKERGLVLATFESCTGGLIGELVTDVPGASAWYTGGIVAYANRIKETMIGVERGLIEEHGAVSEAVARRMAEVGRGRLGADVGVAVSGIAGPHGGTPEKPIGTVFIAVCTSSETTSIRCQFGQGRRSVRERAAFAALDLVRRTIALPSA